MTNVLTLLDRFLSKVHKTETCWIWTGAKTNGYGRLVAKNKTMRAHRLAWELFRGEIPEGLEVCHQCDNKKCVNPDHLFLGTHLDNMTDLRNKKRTVWGIRHRSCRLSEDDARTIRDEFLIQKIPVGKIAAKFGVTKRHIHMIARGERWSQLWQ